MSATVNVILTHHPPETVAKMKEWWQRYAPGEDLLLAYGGTRENFDSINDSWKVFVEDPRVRTRFHQKEKQSFQGVFKAVSAELAQRPDIEWIHFNECDQLPLVPGYSEKILAHALEQQADAAGHFLRRIDGTGHPHILLDSVEEKVGKIIREISIRNSDSTILSMLGCGGFFSREAFDALAAIDDTEGIYLEIFIPTVLHHLGFRIRNIPSQEWAMHPKTRKNPDQALSLINQGAWCAHPVNGLWTDWVPTEIPQ